MTQFQHLANFKSSEGYWHDKNIFKPVILDIYEKYNPKTMLEIGFNIGYSASMWLEFDPTQELKLTSVDIGAHPDTEAAAAAVKSLHEDRFEFILSDSKTLGESLDNRSFDLIFIDGDHSGPGVYNDIHIALKLGVPLLLFDDYHTDKDVNPIRGVCEDMAERKEISLLEIYEPIGIPSKVALYKNENLNSTEKD